jgi:hypothetical protein
MSRRALAIAALVVASVAVVGGCQAYNFNPVGSCLIQPGQKQVKLGDVTTADILFVVDDSYSMDPMQQALAQNFSKFIASLADTQSKRAAQGLDPFDFHIAVTTSSVFRNYSGASFGTTYDPAIFGACTAGVATAGAPYPQGAFVAFGSNSKVLHFTKTLAWATCNPATGACTDSQINALIQQFVGTCSSPAGLCSTGCTGTCSGGNVEVGSCGSGEEQGLQGARLALQKAVGGQQAGVLAGEFPHVGAKLVVVWVGDEDDCSNDPANPILLSGGVGDDSCVHDTNNQRYPIADFIDFFAGLVAPSGQAPSAAHPYVSLGTAYIVAANRCTASDPTTCAPADFAFVQSPASCTGTAQYACGGAYAAGKRFLQLADAFKARSWDVIEGTVCEAFGPILQGIADLVKAPSSLRLPSLPASNEITVLRIVDASGNTRKICTQRTAAGAVGSPTTAEGWWFINCGDLASPPAVASGPTTCVYINHQAAQDPVNSCEANPGETYSAEYMGQIPVGGCPSPSTTGADSLFCAQALKPDAGAADAQLWSCYGTGLTGTCICKQ